ncbi:MAG TPA: carboxypeptidase regulatory-like domain-containing protein [Gemmatimonadaceae bacterium]|nr:carboxypeptidase regulatory-like domain-containing protein [Gemmatimonadaceae bacterium]
MHQFAVTVTLWSICACLLDGAAAVALAQSPTSAAVAGRIVDERGLGVPGVEVAVRNEATGIAMRGASRAGGRYLVGGLEVGGPYSVTARRIGSPPQTRGGFLLGLGQALEVNFTLGQQPVTIVGVSTRVDRDRLFSRAHTGTESFLSDSMIHQLPVLNRDLYDLVRLVPQTSTWFPLAPSGAGTRFNSIRIDGVVDQVPSSNLAAGQLYGGKVIPLDAVKEFQVRFSPFDVREGSFAGASINVVTRSGTNELHGSAVGYSTNERLGANVPFIRGTRYDKQQLGFSLGGPIVRDRLLFFVSSELLRRRIPALGPYVGQPESSPSALPVRAADVTRFQELLNGYALDGGSAGAATNANPSSSSFLRLDAPIARWNSRVTVRGNYGYADSSIFARPTTLAPANCPANGCFPLSSLQHSRWVDKRSLAVQLHSNLANGASNEFVAGYGGLVSGFRPTVMQPLILVTVPGTSNTPTVLQSGTHEIATGQRNTTWTADLSDHLSMSFGAHRVSLGVSTQLFDVRAFQLRGAYGIWDFASLDSLQSGIPSRYRVTRDTGSVTAASGAYHALYLGDQWDASGRLTLTFGIRGDLSVLSARPSYVPAVDSTFGLRSDEVPSGAIAWSPRIGFNYRLSSDGDAPIQLRGGVGLFTGRPPMFWLFGGFSAYGLAARTLQCGSLPSDVGAPPEFRTGIANPSLTCANGRTFGAGASGEIDVIDPNLRLPQTMRATLAADARLPFGMVATLEGLFTRATHVIAFQPVNLAAPIAVDRHGRVMYGTINAAGAAAPRRVAPQLGDVVTITNQSGGHAYDVGVILRRESGLADLSASFNYAVSRDVQSLRTVSSALLADYWRYARPIAGLQSDRTRGTSDFDQPFRVRVSGTLRSPWRRFETASSFFYVGGSGFPYTYVAGGAQSRGDLNADGAAGNDPIYIPRTAFDTAEIMFAGTPADVAAQQAALERFVDGAGCLNDQRGAIMPRNSCRAPWMHLTNLAVRQNFPSVHDHSWALEVQVFNLLNLLNPRWGRIELPTGTVLATTSQIPLLSQVGQTTGPDAQPIYRFDPTLRRYDEQNLDTYYQIQLALRYNF